MKYVDEYRDPEAVRRLAILIRRRVTRPWTLMEVCGGQTHSIVRFGLDGLLPGALSLVHGPGCPVCVTPIAIIDRALDIAARPGVILCSFGDMLRVPGSRGDLLGVRARGGDVRIVHSPTDAVAIARGNPDREVVFFAVGFETTAPATAMAVRQASDEALPNFSMLVSHVLVPPALEAVLGAPECRVNGFLAAGHVCTVMGLSEYEPIAERHGVPIVVTGFEPVDILEGILLAVRELEAGRHRVLNQYERSVRRGGNPGARALIEEVYQPVRRSWRGLGALAASGLGLRPRYAAFDADRRFSAAAASADEPEECRSGLVLMGAIRPTACPAFAVRCTPLTPLGATMVSSEGACAAYYRWRRPEAGAEVLP